MNPSPTTPAQLFRSLGLTLTVRAADDEEDAWACVLTRPDGRVYEIESVSFFEVDPETGDEWLVEPGPTRVLEVLAGGEVEPDGEAEADGDATAGEASVEAAARAFLGDEAYGLLLSFEGDDLDD
jgi:hypothetical protein